MGGPADPVPDRDPVVEVAVADPIAPEHSWSWHLTRVTAVFLAVLLPLHAAVVVLRDDVGTTTLATVTRRFADPRWQGLEWLTLVLALVHAFLVLRTAALRSITPTVLRDAAVVGAGVAAALLVAGLTWSMFSLA